MVAQAKPRVLMCGAKTLGRREKESTPGGQQP